MHVCPIQLVFEIEQKVWRTCSFLEYKEHKAYRKDCKTLCCISTATINISYNRTIDIVGPKPAVRFIINIIHCTNYPTIAMLQIELILSQLSIKDKNICLPVYQYVSWNRHFISDPLAIIFKRKLWNTSQRQV